MGYYIRVLSRQRQAVPLTALREALVREGVKATLEADGEDEREWEDLALAHPDGTEFANVERCPVLPDSLGAEELREFIDDVPDHEPRNAADWLVAYLPSVQTIYALEILDGVETGDGWAAIHAVRNACWNAGDGILQADGEGFSNEDGYHILWQFSDGAKGPWQMAVLNQDGSWTRFEMDLGRSDHRSSFRLGLVPRDAKRG